MRIPSVTVDQMREVDRLAVEEFSLSVAMMMENASRGIAVMCGRLLGGSVKDKKILVLAGKGNNGGDGLGAARHLINYGAEVVCILASPSKELTVDAKRQYQVLSKIKANVLDFAELSPSQLKKYFDNADLIVDALLGYSLKGRPREPYATLIKLANQSGKKTLAVDMPSGLLGDTGEALEPTITATTTLTLALPKAGLTKEKATDHVGDLYLLDLSIPKQVYEKIGVKIPPIFEREDIVRVK